MNHLILIFSILALLFIGCVYSYNWQERRMKEAEALFNNKLIELCYNAKTKEECNEAWRVLVSECLEGNYFKIPKPYQVKFYELRAVLQGKLSIIE